MVETDTGAEPVRYRNIVVAIHWLSAVLIIAQIFIGLKFAGMPKGPDRAVAFDWHKAVGVTILLLAVVRLAVRLMNPPPPFPDVMPKRERAVAVWNHRLFYFLMFALPLTGLSLVSKRAVGGMTELIGGLKFPAISLGPIGQTHALLAWAMIALLVLHVAAALKHQFYDRTIVADRMPPFRSGRARLD